MLLSVGLICMLTTEQNFFDWKWYISIVFAVEGLGRGVFEATCRGVFADFFPNNSEAAFSNLIIASGTASGISSFLFVRGALPQWLIGAISTTLTGIAILSSFAAFRVQIAEREHRPLLRNVV